MPMLSEKYFVAKEAQKLPLLICVMLLQKQAIITRDAIPLVSVDASYMMTKEIGYIRLEQILIGNLSGVYGST